MGQHKSGSRSPMETDFPLPPEMEEPSLFVSFFFTPTKWSEQFGVWWIEITFAQAYINYVTIRCKDCEIHSLWGSLLTNRDVMECKEPWSFRWLQWSRVPGETQRRWTGTGTMHPVNSRNWGHFMYSKWWVKLGVFSFSQRENRDKNPWMEIFLTAISRNPGNPTVGGSRLPLFFWTWNIFSLNQKNANRWSKIHASWRCLDALDVYNY